MIDIHIQGIWECENNVIFQCMVDDLKKYVTMELVHGDRKKIKNIFVDLYSQYEFDEQIVFWQLEEDESAIWSLLLASGYLKAEQVEYRGMLKKPWYHLTITNNEKVG